MTQAETELLVRTIVAQVVKVMAEQGLLASAISAGPPLGSGTKPETPKAWAPSPATREGVLKFGGPAAAGTQPDQRPADGLSTRQPDGRNRFGGRLVTEEIIVTAFKSGQSSITVAGGTIVTPLARDTAREKGVSIIVE